MSSSALTVAWSQASVRACSCSVTCPLLLASPAGQSNCYGWSAAPRDDLEEGEGLAGLWRRRLSAGGMGCGGGIGGMMGSMGDYVHAMGIKQEKVSEHDYRLPLYPGGGVGTGVRSGEELLEVSLGNHQNLVAHDLSLGNVSVPMSVCKKHLDWMVGNYTKEFLTCAFVKRYRTLNLYFTELPYFQYHYILKVKCPLISMEPFHSSKDSLKRSSH